MPHENGNHLRAVPLGIDTYQHHVAFMRADCQICRSEGFDAMTRIALRYDGREIIATLYVVTNPDLLESDVVGLSNSAWRALAVAPDSVVEVRHPDPVESIHDVRGRLFGHSLDEGQFETVMRDIAAGRYSDIELAAFVATMSTSLDIPETIAMTRAMIAVGERLTWHHRTVADKHCVGGLPGNRTTMIVVPIMAAAGHLIPKTSSRAITSPSGTADTMEVITRVNLGIEEMRQVVEREGGCIVWGGNVSLSPADDVLIRVERALDLDGPAQLVASVMSKKAAAGSTHVVIDIPVGPTAKVRSWRDAAALKGLLLAVGDEIGLRLRVRRTDGSQPVGRGIGPALEARDVLAVLRRAPDAPQDLRDRALTLAAELLALVEGTTTEAAYARASRLLDDGDAEQKFLAICRAQGGFREPECGKHRLDVNATAAARVRAIDNRRLATVARLAGAPAAKGAGVNLAVKVGDAVDAGQPLFSIVAETPGELRYAESYVRRSLDIVELEQ